MKNKFDDLGIETVSTSANFILMIFPSEEFTVDFNEECLNKGLILRHVKSFGIPNGIRINSGTIEETNFALNVISEIYPALSEKYRISVNS
jgi:histidinol-phosphate/aromatic aminotransferase/cobyric acid decarboxylase-like protein